MVCSVSRPSSSRYSHSTPIAMKDLELGSTSFSSFKMNLPVSRFLTAEKGRRQSPRHDHSGAGTGHVGREAGRVHRSGLVRGEWGAYPPVCPSHPLPGTRLCQGRPRSPWEPASPSAAQQSYTSQGPFLDLPPQALGCKGFTQPLSGLPSCNLIRATLSCTPPPPPGHRAGVRLPAIGWAYVQLKSRVSSPQAGAL